MITFKTLSDFAANPTRAQYLFIFSAVSSLALFSAILFVPFLAPLLWEMTFLKFLGNLMLSGLVSGFAGSIAHLIFTLDDETVTAKTKATADYQNFYQISLLKWTGILFFALSSILSLASFFLITAPVILPSALIAATFFVIASLVVGAMAFANQYWKFFKYQPKKDPTITTVNNVTQNIQHVTTNNQHHYELTPEQKKIVAALAAAKTEEGLEASERKKIESEEAVCWKELEKVYRSPVIASPAPAPAPVLLREAEKEPVSACCC